MFNKANAKNSTDRQVIIPKGVKLSIMPVFLSQMKNVEFTIDGILYVSEHWKDYPDTAPKKLSKTAVLTFSESDGIVINGKGTYDGRGFMWWVRDIV